MIQAAAVPLAGIVTDTLQFIGLPGQIAVFIATLLTVRHFHEALGALSTVGFVVKILSGIALVLFAGVLGFIPGVSISVSFAEIQSFLSPVVDFVWGLLPF